MTNGIELITTRLKLRQWTARDRKVFAEMNTDPRVMEYFPAPISHEDSDTFVDDQIHRIANAGWGCWAVEAISSGSFLGFVGFSGPLPDWHPIAGSIDIGWRLTPDSWGNGYATEAAAKALEFGFSDVGMNEIIAYTSVCNHRSRAVMNRLGMLMDQDGFEHPRIAEENPLRPHVVYRTNSSRWSPKSVR